MAVPFRWRSFVWIALATGLATSGARAEEGPPPVAQKPAPAPAEPPRPKALPEAIVDARQALTANESDPQAALSLAVLLDQGAASSEPFSTTEGLPPGDPALKRTIFAATKKRFAALVERLGATEETDRAEAHEALQKEGCFGVRVLQTMTSTPEAAKELAALRLRCWKDLAADQYWSALQLAAKDPKHHAVVVEAAQGFQRLVTERGSEAQDKERLAWLEQHLAWFKGK